MPRARKRPKLALHCAARRFAMPIDDARFRLAMSHFASGVTIVTTSHEGKSFGMTVASFASLSLHPPLVLVCIEHSVKTHDAIIAAQKFGVSILSNEQTEISSKFASRSDDRFAGVETFPGALDVPLITGALTAIEFRLHEQLPGGDHTIFVGEVADVFTREGEPLLCSRSGYAGIGDGCSRCATRCARPSGARCGFPIAERKSGAALSITSAASTRMSSATIAISPSTCRPATTTATMSAIPCSTCTMARICSSRNARLSRGSTGVLPKRPTRRSDRAWRG